LLFKRSNSNYEQARNGVRRARMRAILGAGGAVRTRGDIVGRLGKNSALYGGHARPLGAPLARVNRFSRAFERLTRQRIRVWRRA